MSVSCTDVQVIKPENIIFTGCNTNQKSDEPIGGEFFELSSEANDSGVRGSCTYIHF
jgi:hypothetical protein